MKRTEFLSRHISFKKDSYTVTRFRTSNGGAGIELKRGDMSILSMKGDGYQQQANTVAELLTQAAQNHCLLPEVEDEEAA